MYTSSSGTMADHIAIPQAGLKRLSTSSDSEEVSYPPSGRELKKSKRTFQAYTRPDSICDKETELCERCRTIDFVAIFNIVPDNTTTTQGVPVFDLGSISTSAAANRCKACSTFAEMIKGDGQTGLPEPPKRSKHPPKWHLRAYTTGTLWTLGAKDTCLMKRLDIVIAVAEGQPSLTQSLMSRSRSMNRGVILPVLNMSPDSNLIDSITSILRKNETVNFARLKALLSHCDHVHKRCRKKREKVPRFPVGAKVIDCREKKVVELKPEMPYIALSYVWGTHSTSLSIPCESDLLLTHLPRTIADAIDVVEGLGLNYLWVDRYCILQSSHKDKQHQIGQMSGIYSCAYVTICALGEHDETGLPGISVARIQQSLFKTSGLQLSWTGPSMSQILQRSKWKTRGWIFQELVLSRRCLFFTDYDVALACNSQCCHESLLSSYRHGQPYQREKTIFSSSRVLARIEDFDGIVFSEHMTEYQRRQLSYPADLLNAFRGILSELPVKSYWGIRINQRRPTETRTAEEGFLCELRWTATSELRPGVRHTDEYEIPSWSWVGQSYVSTRGNGLASEWSLSSYQQGLFSIYAPKIAVRTLTGESISFTSFYNLHKGMTVLPEETRYIEIRSVRGLWTINKKNATGKHRVEISVDHSNDEILWQASRYPGTLHLDHALCTDPSCSHSAGDNNHCDLPSTGLAILLNIGSKKTVHWLAVAQMPDGTYRRQGLIECHIEKEVGNRTKLLDLILQTFVEG